MFSDPSLNMSDEAAAEFPAATIIIQYFLEKATAIRKKKGDLFEFLLEIAKKK